MTPNDFCGVTMELAKFLKTWEGTQAENKWGRLLIAGLIVVNGILGAKLLFTTPVVTMQPPTLDSEAWVAREQSSQSYQEAWALYLAVQLGNVTPGSVPLLKEWLGPLLAPDVYADVISAIEVQAIQIQNDRVSMRFEPRAVAHEPSTGKTFVYGHSYVIGINGNEQRSERTYEFVVNISRYLPTLTYIDTYGDKPRTERVLRMVERREEMRNKREERKNSN